jgi:hypothetical protein
MVMSNMWREERVGCKCFNDYLRSLTQDTYDVDGEGIDGDGSVWHGFGRGVIEGFRVGEM